MPSKMRYALLISLSMIALVFASVIISYAETTNYVYDEMNRLIRVEYGDGAKIMYTYDEAGNRQYVGLYDTLPPVTTATPPGGTYGTAQSVTLTCNDDISGCNKIYYTTNGNDPNESSQFYSSPINISVTTTLKFFAKDLADNSETIKTETYYIGPESISTPSNPNGPITGYVQTSYTYSTGGATSSYGHSVEYLIDWGDGTNSGWLPVGQTSASHSWSSQGNYLVKAQARCSIHTSVVSDWSGTTSVSIFLPTGNDSYTKSLLHMDGTDGSTTFPDNAFGGTHTWTAYGNAQIDTAQSKFGGASLLLDGTGDYIDTPDSDDHEPAARDFTVDSWVRFNALPGSGASTTFFSRRTGTTVQDVFQSSFVNSTPSKLTFVAYVNTVKVADYYAEWSPSTGTWYHIAVVRNGSSIKLFINGVSQTVIEVTPIGTSDLTFSLSGEKLTIGRKGNSDSNYLNGWIDEFRFSKGIARWTSNFTPPTVAYAGEYTLAVNVVGGGTVTKNPNQPIYSEGASVTLTAVNGSQTFSEWSGDLTGNTNPTTIVMNGNKSVTATFVTPTGWLQGWSYRKPITLSRASGAVTNYQMKLLVGESSGASGENVDCNGHVLSSFNDLRFTTSDGTTLLDYWIESITGTTPNQLATVWIKFDSIGTGATTFYMYYGKSDATAYSNGANTFIAFDDYERGSNGDAVGGSWVAISGTTHISTSAPYGGTRCHKIDGQSPAAEVKLVVAHDNKRRLRFRLKKEANQPSMVMIWGYGSYCTYIYMDSSNNITYNDGSYHDTGYDITPDAWGLWEIYNINTTAHTYSVRYNGTVIMNNVGMWNSSGFAFIYFAGCSAAYNYFIDNLLVTNWESTEPAWGSWGAEQTN